MLMILVLLFSQVTSAQSLPTTLAVAGGRDSSESRTGSFDVSIGVRNWGLVEFGAGSLQTQYDGVETKAKSFYLGIRSNPLYDFSMGLELAYQEFSQQLESGTLSVPVNYYWRDFALRLIPGLKVLTLQLTQQLQSETTEVKDESMFGTIEVMYFINSRYQINAFYSQYSYQKDFSPLTSERALLFGYLPATVEGSAGLLDFSLGGGGSYLYKNFSTSLDISTSQTKFVASTVNMATLSFGYSLTESFYLTLAKGWTRVVEGDERYRGDFSNLGFSYTLP